MHLYRFIADFAFRMISIASSAMIVTVLVAGECSVSPVPPATGIAAPVAGDSSSNPSSGHGHPSAALSCLLDLFSFSFASRLLIAYLQCFNFTLLLLNKFSKLCMVY